MQEYQPRDSPDGSQTELTTAVILVLRYLRLESLGIPRDQFPPLLHPLKMFPFQKSAGQRLGHVLILSQNTMWLLETLLPMSGLVSQYCNP